MLYASAKNSCTKILKPSFENRLEFMPTNIKCLGKVWTICLWITRELINHVTLSVSELEYFWSVETMKISLYAQARRLPLLQVQSSVWNCLSFLNNFLMFLHKFNEIFRVNCTWISDCRACSILKTVPVSLKILKNMLNASAENLSTTTRNLYLESLSISEQTLNTLARFRW